MGMVKKALQLVKRTLTRPEGLTLEDLGPVSRYFGEDRGTPIDRYYIHQFLEQNRRLISGTVLEIADDKYCRMYGSGVSKYEVLHISKENLKATIIGDLTIPSSLPTATIDCFVCTQTFNFIYDFSKAIQGAYQVLKQGGFFVGHCCWSLPGFPVRYGPLGRLLAIHRFSHTTHV